MAEAQCSDGKCLIPTCNTSVPVQTFKIQAIKKFIECASKRHDDETIKRLQTIVDTHGENSSVTLHKNCYCSFTSKDHI